MASLAETSENCHSKIEPRDSVIRKFLLQLIRKSPRHFKCTSQNWSPPVSKNMRSFVLVAIANLIGAISAMSIPKSESHDLKQERQTDPCLRSYGPCDPLRFDGECCSDNKGFIFCNSFGAVQFQACVVPESLHLPPLTCYVDSKSGEAICGASGASE